MQVYLQMPANDQQTYTFFQDDAAHHAEKELWISYVIFISVY